MDETPFTLPVLMVGLSHKGASIEVRERLAVCPDRLPAILQGWVCDGTSAIKEAVLLSTCNRTEYYVVTDDPAQARSFLFDFMSKSTARSTSQLRAGSYTHQGDEAILHLMHVACGLDSLVMGENEILGQVRMAGELARSARTVGPCLSTLFRYAIQAGKRARAETEIGRGNISVATVVVELAHQAFGSLKDRTALVIGAGKISAITARALSRSGLHCIMVANRTYERAEKLAKSLNGTAIHFDRLSEFLVQADIVICSTGAPHTILHPNLLAETQKARQAQPMLVADLAVPRDVDPEVASIAGIRLVNIDDLAITVKEVYAPAVPTCQAVEKIIQEELVDFRQWYLGRKATALIQALYQKADGIYQAEVDQTLRRLGKLSPHQERLVQAMGKAIVGKMLYEPTIHLRSPSERDDLSAYINLVQDLFGVR